MDEKPRQELVDLISRIDAWGRSAPERLVHQSDAASLTWGDLIRRSDALAGAIASSGLRPGSPIVLRGHKEPEMLVGFLGCAKSAHPYVPIDVAVPESRAERIVAAANAEMVLTPERIRELEALGLPRPLPSGDLETPFYVMFTSGSTGEPKGVVITRECLDAFVSWMLREQQFAAGGETFLNQAVFSFDLSVMDVWCCLATGGTLFSLTATVLSDFRRLFQSLAASGVTTWVSTPPFAQLCLADRGFRQELLPHLTRFLFCGDVLTGEVAERLIERFPKAEVWNTYGPTEAPVATTSVHIRGEVLRRYPQLPVGVAMPGTNVLVVDDGSVRVTDGTRGEIMIVGPNVSPGYLGRPDLSARVFSMRDGVRAYRTGDWGVYEDGLLFFHGRMDNQVKIAGHRIELGDVEAQVASLASVRGAAVVTSMKHGRADSLHAFVVLVQRPPGSDLEIGAALRKEVASLLPAYMLPRKFHLLDRFPLTANGKTDRKALAAMVNA